MNIMLFVPSTRPSITWASHTNSFLYDAPHTLRYFWFFMRCRISISDHVSSSKTVLSICIGNFLLERFAGATLNFVVYTHTSITSWVNDQNCVLLIVLYAGSTCCVSFTHGNVASFIFGVSAANFGDRLGYIILVGGWGFWFLGSDCCIGLSTLEVGWSSFEMVVLAGLLRDFI